MEFEDFGYLRRVYVDDIGVQLPMLSSTAPVKEVRERLRNPLAVELLLGTLHQLPGPHIRSILQLGLVSADVGTKLKDHLKALCMKPSAQTIVLSPVRLPSTLHCVFSFYLHTENRYEYLAKLIWQARETIPGRAVIFIQSHEDILQVRRTLRGFGMNAKIFSEVYGNGQFQEKWKFLLLRESEAFGTDIPLVSHVFVSFAPQSWQTFLHMSGRAGRLGNVGWVFTITDKRDAKHVRRVAEDLSVDFTNHIVDVNLAQVPPASVDSFTKDPELFGMDPQYVVQQHYEVQAENPDMANRSREFFSKPAYKQFQMENYTPVAKLQRRFDSAGKLARDVERNPSIVLDMARKGLVDDQLRPTKRLKDQMDLKTSKRAPSPFEKKR
ncbi:unnamed protein product [Phytomonas sp. EM1]|nr:unnamed protein product [Phytomonas sp. EM1]|eukprot:CCW60597.1 unnamed protein product [Phytomonas sp. isolate EM1]